jgi:predicted nucleic acid-binding protein
VTAVYIDSSAFVKTVIAEPESRALLSYLGRRKGDRVSSALLLAEAIRTARHYGADALANARLGLRQVDLIAITDAVLESAGGLEPRIVRTLDAIHLATALSLGRDLDAIITYDERMTAGARLLGLQVRAPR